MIVATFLDWTQSYVSHHISELLDISNEKKVENWTSAISAIEYTQNQNIAA